MQMVKLRPMKPFNFFIGIIFWLGFYPLNAQIIWVKDQVTQQPISNASIVSHNPQYFGITDSLGKLNISLWIGVKILEISHLGYQKAYKEITPGIIQVELDPSSSSLEEIFVSAERWQQNTGKVASISPERINFIQPQTTADALGATGEVFIQKSQQGGGSPMIRGFAANRLLYSVDGVRMNTAIFRSGNLQNVISLDPFSLEKTEVLFGPGAVLYGSDAIGGVLNFQTLDPHSIDSISTHIFSRYSSANNELTQHADWRFSKNKWGLVSSVTYSHFGDLKMGKYGPEDYLKTYVVKGDDVLLNKNPRVQNPTGYDQWNIMQKVSFKPDEHWNFQYGFHYSSTTNFSRYDRLIETREGLPLFAVWNYGPQKWMMNHLNISNPKLGMSINLAAQQFEESRIDRRLNQERLRTQKEVVEAYSLNVDFEKGKIRYGIEWVLNDVESSAGALNINSGNSIEVAPRYPQSIWQSFGAYLQYDQPLGKFHRIQAGVRYSDYQINADFRRQTPFFSFDFEKTNLENGALTGSLAWNTKFSNDWKMDIGISTGFRAPNVDDIGKIFDFVSGEVIVPNPELKGEYAWNGELNVSKTLEGLKLEGGLFYTRLNGAMVRRPFSLNGQDSIVYNGIMSKIYALQNAAFVEVLGWTLGLAWRINSAWKLYSRFNFQRGVEEMDNGERSPSRHSAPHFGTSGISWSSGRWNLELYGVFQNRIQYERLNLEEKGKSAIYAKDELGRPWSPGWYAVHFKGGYSLNSHWRLGFGLENLTNQRYRPYSSGLAGQGFNAIISIQGRF